jgi:hypothetical protein
MNAALDKSKVQRIGLHRPLPQFVFVFQSPTPATGVAPHTTRHTALFRTRRKCTRVVSRTRSLILASPPSPASLASLALSFPHPLTPLLHSRSFSLAPYPTPSHPLTHHPQFASRWGLCWKRGAATTTTSMPPPT